jgi:hypothetical protein
MTYQEIYNIESDQELMWLKSKSNGQMRAFIRNVLLARRTGSVSMRKLVLAEIAIKTKRGR